MWKLVLSFIILAYGSYIFIERENLESDSNGLKNSDYSINDNELKILCEELFDKDSNKLGKYVTYNVQDFLHSNSRSDLAHYPLLTVQPEVFNIPIVKALIALYDNYESSTKINEYVTSEEEREVNYFLNELMKSPVINHLMTFLYSKKIISSHYNAQYDLLKQIWFHMYSRNKGVITSSGFEHIFLSEIKKGKISGLHNWLYFHYQEITNNINYHGYRKLVKLDNAAAVLQFAFSLDEIYKPITSMFIGTSPELEIALYTMCFILRPEKSCKLAYRGQKFSITTYVKIHEDLHLIASAYPDI